MADIQQMLALRFKAIEKLEKRSVAMIQNYDDFWDSETIANLKIDIQRIIEGEYPIYYPGVLFNVAGVKSAYQYRFGWSKCTLKESQDIVFNKIGEIEETKEIILMREDSDKKYYRRWQDIATIEGQKRTRWELEQIYAFFGMKKLELFEGVFWVEY